MHAATRVTTTTPTQPPPRTRRQHRVTMRTRIKRHSMAPPGRRRARMTLTVLAVRSRPSGTIECRSVSDCASPCQRLGGTGRHSMTRSGTIRTRADSSGRTRTITRKKADDPTENHDTPSRKPPLQQPPDGRFPLPSARFVPPGAPDRWRANGERAPHGLSDTRWHDPNLYGRWRTRTISGGRTIRHRATRNGIDWHRMALILVYS
jgi:hypothetical protein